MKGFSNYYIPPFLSLIFLLFIPQKVFTYHIKKHINFWMIIGYFNSKLTIPINPNCPQTCTPWWCASNFRQHYFQVTAAQNCHYMFAIVILSVSTTQITTDTKETNKKLIWFYSSFYFMNPIIACMGFFFPRQIEPEFVRQLSRLILHKYLYKYLWVLVFADRWNKIKITAKKSRDYVYGDQPWILAGCVPGLSC